MSLELWIHKRAFQTRWARLPGFAALDAWARKQMQGKLYRLPYLEGTVHVNPLQSMGHNIFLHGRYEPTITEVVRHFARAGYHFVDVGANIGLHTLAAAFMRQSKGQKLVAFEPEPHTFSRLQINCRQNNLAFVSCYRQALGDKPNTLTLHTSTDINEGSHSLLPRPHTAPDITVQVTTLDRRLPTFVPTGPTLLKIDVEGFEPAVLQGGQNWLRHQTDLAVLCEISPALLRTQGQSPQIICQLLQSAGLNERYIVRDYDTFVDDRQLRNDYFNILCFKGYATQQLVRRLPPETFLRHLPPNAPAFVEWQTFSTLPLQAS